MNNTIFYLIGATAPLRLAVATEIAARTGARIVDSQDVYAPIFNLVDHEHPANMPDAVWTEIDAVRAAILKTIETLSPAGWNFVFTHAGIDIPADVGVYRSVRDMAARRGARFLPVTLSDKPRKLLAFDEADAVVVDMTGSSADAAASEIVNAAG